MPIMTGAIVMWSGLVENIPEGWALCDGQNGTLDLRNRFIIGAGSTYSVGNTGGSANAVVVTHTHSMSGSTGSTNYPSHSHLLYNTPGGTAWGSNDSSPGAGSGNASSVGSGLGALSSSGNHSHGIGMSTTGEDGTNKNLPPYYALAYIQQIV